MYRLSRALEASSVSLAHCLLEYLWLPEVIRTYNHDTHDNPSDKDISVVSSLVARGQGALRPCFNQSCFWRALDFDIGSEGSCTSLLRLAKSLPRSRNYRIVQPSSLQDTAFRSFHTPSRLSGIFKMKQSIAALLLFAFGAQHTIAATLYIPFLDPQPITADIEGVDASGHTTWRIGPGVHSGAFTDDSGLFTSATLVEGATDAHLVEIDTALGFSISGACGISGGIAVCTVVASNGIISTDTVTETASGFEVQLGATPTATVAPPSVTGTPGAASQTPGASAGGSPPASAGSGAESGPGAAPTGSGTSGSASPSATNGNGAGKTVFSVSAVGIAILCSMVAFVF
ncbi:hypothetical protein OH77DRAFT_1429482 [Trametes cingulata]|nr:hypothetical protein OH77DRAFT_1429482 [Trametes cingulata]